MRGLVTLVVLTVFEFLGLVLWFQIVNQEGATVVHHIVGLVILAFGLFAERFSVYIGMIRPITGDINAMPYAQRFIIQGVRESLIWFVWLWIFRTIEAPWLDYIGSFVFLFVAMLFEHMVDVAEHNNKPRFFYMRHPTMLFLTLVEAAGATAWIYFAEEGASPTLSLVILFVAFIIEHIFQGQMVEIKAPEQAA
jgi:hypothetical protein